MDTLEGERRCSFYEGLNEEGVNENTDHPQTTKPGDNLQGWKFIVGKEA